VIKVDKETFSLMDHTRRKSLIAGMARGRFILRFGPNDKNIYLLKHDSESMGFGFLSKP